jgi:hypothetical protein
MKSPLSIIPMLLLAACTTEPTNAPPPATGPASVSSAADNTVVRGSEFEALFSGKAIRTRYNHSATEFVYEFFPNKDARRTIVVGGQHQESGTWSVKGDQLCIRWPSANLCYDVQRSGKGYVLTREFNGRKFSETAGEPVPLSSSN